MGGWLMVEESRINKLCRRYPRQYAGNYIQEIMTTGKGKEFVLKELENAMRRIPACYLSHQEMAKPGTINDPLALEGYYYSMRTANPNNVDSQMFYGSFELEQEAKAITAYLLNYPVKWKKDGDPEYIGGWFLNGGTESIIQACWIYRNKYFYEKFACPKHSQLHIPEFIKKREGLFRDLFSIRRNGWFKMYPEYSKLYGQHRVVPSPKILAPINAHFALTKAADILGFGQDNIEYYYLKEDGRPDPDSVREKTKRIIDRGDDIAMFWVQVGDTERGILSDTSQLDSVLKEAYDQKGIDLYPPTLVDAAAQYLFAAVMKDSENYVDIHGNSKTIPPWDFQVENVKAIVVDPHKNQVPYPASILILRDPDDSKHTVMDDAYLSLDLLAQVESMSEKDLEHTQHNATIPTSRAGYGVIATWAYYVGNGIENIRKRKEKIWSNVLTLWRELVEGELPGIYELVCEPDSALVCFRLSPNWIKENMEKIEKSVKIDERIIKMYEEKLGLTPNLYEMLAGKASYEIYEQINNSTRDWLYIARSKTLLTRTENEFKDYMRKDNELEYLNYDLKKEGKEKIDERIWEYIGLMAHIIEHNRKKDIELLIKRLKEEAEKLLMCG